MKKINYDVKDKFDHLATRYSRQYQDRSILGFEKVRRMRLLDSAIADRESMRILDAGCGSGIVMRSISKKNNHNRLFGLDISMHMLKASRLENDSDLPLVQSLIEAVPFGDRSFDLVFSLGVLDYVNDTKQVFETMSSIIKPGGFFIFTYPNRDCISRSLRDKLSSIKNLSTKRVSAQPIGNGTVDKLIIEHGFSLKMRKFITYGSGLFSLPWSLYMSERFENNFAHGLIGRYLGWTCFCIAQKS